MNKSFDPVMIQTEAATLPDGLNERYALRRFQSLRTLLHQATQTLCCKLELADALLAFYVAGFVRQYLWGVSNNRLAWMLTIFISLAIGAFHLARREAYPRAVPSSFWLIVALPLLAMFSMRAPFPDFNFDTLNYHLVNTERALRGWPFIPGDFFPGVLQVNPAPDLASAIFRYALGYRLGTLINLLVLLWTAMILERLLRTYIKSNRLRCACVLLVVSTEHILFLLNLYMIDLLALPLLLEATYLSLRFTESKKKDYALVNIAFFLGISVAFKLTNLAFAVPIVLVCAHQAICDWFCLDKKYLLLAAVAFLAPFVPFSIFMYWQTGNPIFPYYNAVFRSPFVAISNYKDTLHGPETFWQSFIWPVWSFIYPERLSAMNGGNPYTGRVCLGFLVAALGLLSKGINKEIRALCFITLLGSILWSLASGDIRYGLYLEIVGGLAIVTLLASLYLSAPLNHLGKRSPQMLAVLFLFGSLLTWQFVASYQGASLHHEQLFNRTVQATVFEDFDGYVREARHFFTDRSPEQFFSASDRELFDKVDVWINSYDTTSGVEVIARRDIPMLSVCKFLYLFDYLETKGAQERLAQTLATLKGKRMYSLGHQSHLKDSLKFISRTGLTIGQITPVKVPFYSQRTRLHMAMIEVLPPGEGLNQDDLQTSALANLQAEDAAGIIALVNSTHRTPGAVESDSKSALPQQ